MMRKLCVKCGKIRPNDKCGYCDMCRFRLFLAYAPRVEVYSDVATKRLIVKAGTVRKTFGQEDFGTLFPQVYSQQSQPMVIDNP